MIRQQVGDLLEIEYEGKFYYVVVLTKVIMFGGNIVFAYHTDGKQLSLESLTKIDDGFNICTDLILPKRDGVVRRLTKVEDTASYWRTKLFKRVRTNFRGWPSPSQAASSFRTRRAIVRAVDSRFFSSPGRMDMSADDRGVLANRRVARRFFCIGLNDGPIKKLCNQQPAETLAERFRA